MERKQVKKVILVVLANCFLFIVSPVMSGDKSAHHTHFSHFKNVKTLENENFLIIESNGLPDHSMMKGITSWQQQVPLPQNYKGNNSWKLPLKPTLATEPLLTKDHFYKVAIAIAVNGVPIFNAFNISGINQLFISLSL